VPHDLFAELDQALRQIPSGHEGFAEPSQMTLQQPWRAGSARRAHDARRKLPMPAIATLGRRRRHRGRGSGRVPSPRAVPQRSLVEEAKRRPAPDHQRTRSRQREGCLSTARDDPTASGRGARDLRPACARGPPRPRRRRHVAPRRSRSSRSRRPRRCRRPRALGARPIDGSPRSQGASAGDPQAR
jgi:hypothetical protein